MRLSTVILAALFCCSCASAATIYIDSQQGLFTSFDGLATVAITPHPLWEGNHPVNPGDPADSSAIWISYADTGYGGTYFQPPADHSPVATIFDTFRSGAGMLTLYVWADDTAGVLLDGNLLMPPVFTQNTCSGQAIGCRPQDNGAIAAALSEGQHTLSFVLYQVGTGLDSYSNPLGLLFTGTAPAPTLNGTFPGDSDAPEPAAWGLIGGGLALLAASRYRQR
jgi:hypothetical protein